MPSFWLEVQQGSTPQQHSYTRVPITIGRDRGGDLVLDHPTVSRQHAQVQHDPQRGFTLRVLSTSGLTAVDGVQVSGEVPLYDNSRINLGQVAITFRSPEAFQRPGAAMGGFGQQAPMGNMGGFGQQPQGFGQPAAGGFGQPAAPSGGGFGMQAPAAAGGFGQPQAPMGGGFGMQAPAVTPQGFGQPAAPASGGFSQPGAQPGGFSQPGAQPGGFNALGGDRPANAPVATNVWDEIAQNANDAEEDDDGPRDDEYFKRMEAAQAKGQEKAQGRSPLVIVAGVMIVGLMAFILWPSGGKGGGDDDGAQEGEQNSQPFALEVSCANKEECLIAAEERYKIAKANYEKKDVRMTNAFMSYKGMLEAQELLKQGKVETPDNMKDMQAIIDSTRQELDALFREQRRNYFSFKQRKMYRDMIACLDIVNSYFPDSSSPEAQWAAKQERAMRKAGVYRR